MLAEYIDCYLITSVALFESRCADKPPLFYKETVEAITRRIKEGDPFLITRLPCADATEYLRTDPFKGVVSLCYEGEWARVLSRVGVQFVVAVGLHRGGIASKTHPLEDVGGDTPEEGEEISFPPSWVVSKLRQLDSREEEPMMVDDECEEEGMLFPCRRKKRLEETQVFEWRKGLPRPPSPLPSPPQRGTC